MAKAFSRLYYQKQHRKDVFWQIWLPIGTGAVAFLALGAMAGFSLQTGTESAARWGHIAVMWMLLPVFAIGMISLIILIGLIFGVFKLIQILPKYTIILQIYFQRIARVIQKSTNKTVQPVMIFRSNRAAIHRFIVAIQYLLFGGNNE